MEYGDMENGNAEYDWVEARGLLRSTLEDFDGVLVCRDALDSRIAEHLAEACSKASIPGEANRGRPDLLVGSHPPEGCPFLLRLAISPA